MSVVENCDEGNAEVKVGGAQAVRRAVEVVRTVAQLQRSGATLAKVTKATDLSSPTAYRLLRTLTEERLLVFDPSTRFYHVGPLAFELGLAALPEVRTESRWQNAVQSVAQRTRLTSYLIARSNDEAVCLLCAEGTAVIRAMPMQIGQRVPLGFGAGSLAILASLSDDEVTRIVQSHCARYEVFPGGQHALAQLPARIAETRRRGFSLSSGTVAQGVVGLGVLIPAEREALPTAITVSAVADAFDENEAKQLAGILSETIASQ